VGWLRLNNFARLIFLLSGISFARFAHSVPEPACSDPAVLFCDNFEDRPVNSTSWAAVNVGPKTPPWDMSDTSGIQISDIVPGPAGGYSRAMVFKYPACFWNDGLSDKWHCGVGYGAQYFNSGDYYVRLYAYYSPGFLFSTVADKFFALLDNAGRAPWAWHIMWGDPEPHMENEAHGNTNYYQNSNLPAFTWQTGKWHCLEMHVKQGSGNGILEGWVDNVQKFNYANVNFPSAWNALFISGYGNTGSDNQAACTAAGFTWDGTYCHRGPQQRYFDNIVISTKRIGCLETAPPPAPADSTPPVVSITAPVSGSTIRIYKLASWP
jgi:hypothetical protein